MRSISVMVVDDESPIVDMVEIMVNRIGGFHVVAKAYNGKKAVKVYKDSMPDILICDIKMPYKSGLDLVREIESISPNANIIIMSGYSDFQYAQTAIKLNVREYLLKPINENELKECLKKIADNIRQAESLKSKIFGMDKYKDAAQEAEVRSELLKIVGNININDFKQIEQSIKIIFAKLENQSVTMYTIESVLSTIDALFGINTQELMVNCTNYETLYKKVIIAVKKVCQTSVSLSANEIVDLLEYQIRNNYSENLSGKQMFDQFGYNEVYLINVFKREKGITPKQLLQKVRMEKAIELMKENPGILLKTVAEMVGYQDQLYFSKLFKEVVGVSPSTFIKSL